VKVGQWAAGVEHLHPAHGTLGREGAPMTLLMSAEADITGSLMGLLER
jgi:hypothetical protein